ncbi:hypothetical protein PRIPAC_70570 [Pristionchus pacificus]|uniref:Uncharacterized protein n=1 Tax=Pristionchus pacificus TaxID=54126 RepID=A0A2A6C791_PRIPA|nr:hypothetical protein PRIPAC_70570 [Pristionchus pacificus]|eukprot:PDM73970.1 hypothetical protein PRIPAC_41326 [Pristionchus pacificus]
MIIAFSCLHQLNNHLHLVTLYRFHRMRALHSTLSILPTPTQSEPSRSSRLPWKDSDSRRTLCSVTSTISSSMTLLTDGKV